MLSSADMLIAHCIIAVDAMTWDAPPTKRARATKMAKNRRAAFSSNMPVTVPIPQIAVKDVSAKYP